MFTAKIVLEGEREREMEGREGKEKEKNLKPQENGKFS